MSSSSNVRSFPNDSLRSLREMPLQQACDQLGFFWKEDPVFSPLKDAKTKRVYVSRSDGGVFELLITTLKWYDPKADRGGGGAIDLAMHLLPAEFVSAVKALTKVKRL